MYLNIPLKFILHRTNRHIHVRTTRQKEFHKKCENYAGDVGIQLAKEKKSQDFSTMEGFESSSGWCKLCHLSGKE